MLRMGFVRRIGFSVLTAMVMIALAAGVVLAAVTWHSGPTVTFNGTTSATASGDGSGFGNQPAQATLTVNATVTYTCVNKGGNASPGQNPVPETSSGSADLGNADHNGRGTCTDGLQPQSVRRESEVSDLLELALHGLLAGAASRGSGRLAFRRALTFA